MLSLILALGLAQEGLTPTDVHDFGEFSASLRAQIAQGQGDLTTNAFDLDFDLAQYSLLLQGAVGLGMGFEVEAQIPYLIQGTSDAEGDVGGIPSDIESESLGFGDAQLGLVYRLLKEDATSPQLILGALVVAPTGNDADGRADGNLGVLTLDGEEGGAGDGVWSYGVGAGVSRRFGMFEPYLVGAYLFGGNRTQDGVDEERSDVGTVILGAELHVTGQATIDVRIIGQFVGEDVQEDGGAKKEAEDHFDHTYAATLYVNLGPGLTLLAGGALTFVGDHEVDTAVGLELEDSILYSFQLGLHLNFGGK
jgi:hypothetical protein